MPTTAYIGLGANLGNPHAAIEAALTALDKLPDTRVLARSGLFRTAPVDAVGPDFINAVAKLSTSLDPERLLECLQGIETSAGRLRPFKNAPRTLDLDVLLYGDEIVRTPNLEIPHPRMHQRAFVLLPLWDIAGDCTVPGHGPISELLKTVVDQAIERISFPTV